VCVCVCVCLCFCIVLGSGINIMLLFNSYTSKEYSVQTIFQYINFFIFLSFVK